MTAATAGDGAAEGGARGARESPPPPPPPRPPPFPDAPITSLGLEGDGEARVLLRRALRDAWPAVRRFCWRVGAVCELPPSDGDVGYTSEDGTLFVKVRDPAKNRGRFYPYSFVLATLLHELSHLSHLGHGKAFYRRLREAAEGCGADPAVRREVRQHVCGELLNAVCDNDARRAKALLAVLPEAVACRLPGPGRQPQLPLEYAAHHGRVALTRLLLEARADAQAAAGSYSGPPPLELAAARAASRGNARTAQVLVEAGARGAPRARGGGSSFGQGSGRPAPPASPPPPAAALPAQAHETAEAPEARGCAARPSQGARQRLGARRRRAGSLPVLPALRVPKAAALLPAASAFPLPLGLGALGTKACAAAVGAAPHDAFARGRSAGCGGCGGGREVVLTGSLAL